MGWQNRMHVGRLGGARGGFLYDILSNDMIYCIGYDTCCGENVLWARCRGEEVTLLPGLRHEMLWRGFVILFENSAVVLLGWRGHHASLKGCCTSSRQFRPCQLFSFDSELSSFVAHRTLKSNGTHSAPDGGFGSIDFGAGVYRPRPFHMLPRDSSTRHLLCFCCTSQSKLKWNP
jgi:hypothetical protein